MHFRIIIQAFYFNQIGISAYLPCLHMYAVVCILYVLHEKIIQFEISMSIYISLLIDAKLQYHSSLNKNIFLLDSK